VQPSWLAICVAVGGPDAVPPPPLPQAARDVTAAAASAAVAKDFLHVDRSSARLARFWSAET